MLKIVASFVLSRVSRCGVAQGYASLATLPAASPEERRVLARRGWVGENDGYFEHPALTARQAKHLPDYWSVTADAFIYSQRGPLLIVG